MTAFWRYGPGPSTDASQPARAVLDADVSEADFQAAVVELAMWRGWRVHAERPARTSKGWRTPIQGDTGFVDLVLARRRPSKAIPELGNYDSGLDPYVRILFIELKSARGVMSDDQSLWLLALMGVPGVEYFCWRPAAWPEIEVTLR